MSENKSQANQDYESIPSLGGELLFHAHEHGNQNKLPLITQLFPYLLIASRQLTTREMSRWLKDEKGVEISAQMISKGLQRPEIHLRRIAEYIEPLAIFISAISGKDIDAILFHDPDSGRSYFREFETAFRDKPDVGNFQSELDALNTFSDFWYVMPSEVKYMCRRYFGTSDGPDSEDSEDENLDGSTEISNRKVQREA